MRVWSRRVYLVLGISHSFKNDTSRDTYLLTHSTILWRPRGVSAAFGCWGLAALRIWGPVCPLGNPSRQVRSDCPVASAVRDEQPVAVQLDSNGYDAHFVLRSDPRDRPLRVDGVNQNRSR
jgi:hypothetical protein